ncbi:virulence-associated E family protein [Anaeromyxobacter sp. SG66]|uniref:virulence-associated E family protein n=1 Tax=Anaeromyxobacter sp. SG66 TaxID=2925410 RepID=UPI001F5965E5|nr:virulence-associated E family protein [Anaeromyxobacter sp. SG66]
MPPEFLSSEHGVECYVGKAGRYLTVTGHVLEGRAGLISDITPAATQLLAKFATRLPPAEAEPTGAEIIPLPRATAPAPMAAGRAADLDALAAKDDTDLEFFAKGLPVGDRSERLYRALRRLLERGISPDEILAWAWSRPGIRKYSLAKRNYRGERAALELLRAEVERAVRNEPPPLVPDPASTPDTIAPAVDDSGYEYGVRGRSRFVKRIAWNVTRFLVVAALSLRLRLNERFGRIECNGKPLITSGAAFNELVRDMCRLFDWDTAPSVEALTAGFLGAAERDAYDPVTEYLDSLTHDGTDRLSALLDAMGVERTPLNVAMMTKFLIAAVARARRPGCKADDVLILVGAQGDKKSMIVRALASAPERNADPTAPSELYSDAPVTAKGNDKDSAMVSESSWIHELGELTSVRAADRNDVKAALSRQEERYRPPYGREVVTRPRRGIRVGTTNDPQFLNDPTGARRFWPLHVTREINISWVMENRDQLWAQADAAFKADTRWWFAKNEHGEEMRERHEAAYDADNIEITLTERLTRDLLDDWQREGAVLLSDVAGRIGIDLARAPRNFPNRLGDALTRLGFVRTQVRRDGQRVRAWKHKSWDTVPLATSSTPTPSVTTAVATADLEDLLS